MKGGVYKFMRINKKGLSDVITAVLIILLVLAAIVIIWSFVKPAIETSGGSIEPKSKCVSTTVEPVSCHKGTAGYQVLVKSNAAENVTIRAVLHLGSGATLTNASSVEIVPYETYNASFSTATVGGDVTARGVAVIAGYACDESTETQNCPSS